MRSLGLAGAMLIAANTAFAGNLEEPVVEPQVDPPVVIEEAEAGSSASGIWIPLVLLALVAAAVSAD